MTTRILRTARRIPTSTVTLVRWTSTTTATGWISLSSEKCPRNPPRPWPFRLVQEKHNPRPSNDTVLVNILEDDEGFAREKTYSVWEMKSQNRKIKDGENIHLASYLDEGNHLHASVAH